MRVALWPYKPGSKSAKNLAEMLDVNRIKHEGSKFKGWGKKTHLIINWGSTECPDHNNVLNPSELIRTFGNKLRTFEVFAKAGLGGPRTPDWTDNREVAREWAREGFLVVCRSVLTGHSGRGITITNNSLDIPDNPCYTKYVKKASEYRIHYVKVDDETADAFYVQKKVKRPDFEGEPNFKIRSHENGFIFQHDNVFVPDDVYTQALAAFQVSNLDFGAVDVIYNKRQERAYVLEINTAPGLEGLSIERYSAAFQTHLFKGPIETGLKKRQFAEVEEDDEED